MLHIAKAHLHMKLTLRLSVIAYLWEKMSCMKEYSCFQMNLEVQTLQL